MLSDKEREVILGAKASADDLPSVTVEFYGAARHLAGTASVAMPAGRLTAVVAAIEVLCPPLSGRLMNPSELSSPFRLSLDGQRFLSDPAEIIAPGARLLVLAADAGG